MEETFYMKIYTNKYKLPKKETHPRSFILFLQSPISYCSIQVQDFRI